jgi:hypothetical protein
MRTPLLLFRFYRTVAPVPPLVTALSVTVLLVSAGLAVLLPGGVAAPLAALLVLQIFAASSGVIGPARRGYYDPLLARGVARAHILWGHWLASTIPGAICWTAAALIDRLAGDEAGIPRALTSGSLVAFWLVSSIPWAATVTLPRFAAAIAWLILLVTTLTTLPAGQAALISAVDGRAATPWAPVVTLVYPMGLVGLTLTPAHWRIVVPAMVLSIAAPAAAFVWFVRADIPLEASQ